MFLFSFVCVCVRVCVRACVCVCVRVCVTHSLVVVRGHQRKIEWRHTLTFGKHRRKEFQFVAVSLAVPVSVDGR